MYCAVHSPSHCSRTHSGACSVDSQACHPPRPLQVIQTIRSGAVFYCATLHPEPAKSHMVLAGASDKKVYQFDFNSGDLIQEYHYHIGAVNTVTFIEENRMFVSSADDKTLRVWELGVPVQVRAPLAAQVM